METILNHLRNLPAGYRINERGVYFPRSIDELKSFPQKLQAYRKQKANGYWRRIATGNPLFGKTCFGTHALVLTEEISDNLRGTCLAMTAGRLQDAAKETMCALKGTVFIVDELIDLVKNPRRVRPNQTTLHDSGEYTQIHPANRTHIRRPLPRRLPSKHLRTFIPNW